MTNSLKFTVAFVLAMGLSWALVPVAIRLAVRTDFLDRPGGYKEHSRSTPYLGGLAVMAGFSLTVLLLDDAFSDFRTAAICALVLLVVGTVDDRMGLGIKLRLAIEIGVAASMCIFGQSWDLTSFAALNYAITIAWVVGLINAVNLMDNLDGAASTVSAVSAAGIGGLAIYFGNAELAVVCLALAGACAGFLPHNLSGPAKIFLGDGGSMPIGFLLAAGTMSIHPEIGWESAALSCLLVAVPILDMGAVIVSRRRRGVGVFVGGRDHMTHRIYRHLGSTRSVALVLLVCQGALSLVAILLATASSGAALFVLAGLALIVLTLALATLDTLMTGINRRLS